MDKEEQKELREELKEIFADIDAAFEDNPDYEELNKRLFMVWLKHGLISGKMVCGLGGSIEG